MTNNKGNKIEAAAREAAERFIGGIPRVPFMGGALEACRVAYQAGFKDGHASCDAEIAEKDREISRIGEARGRELAVLVTYLRQIKERDSEIASLRAKLAAMREPLWMLRSEHEAEMAELRARLEAAEARSPRWVRYTSEEWESLVRDGWKFAIDSEDDPFRPHLLMVKPVPLPETEP